MASIAPGLLARMFERARKKWKQRTQVIDWSIHEPEEHARAGYPSRK